MELGLVQGIEREFEKRNNDLVLRILKDNLDINYISKYTDISVEELKNSYLQIVIFC